MEERATPYLFLTSSEAAFIEAAVNILIPADELSPSATECGVVVYIDRQLVSGWGKGDRTYRQGPWRPGLPTQGNQLPLVPAEIYRIAVAAIDAEVRSQYGSDFYLANDEQKSAILVRLEAGELLVENGLGKIFFELLYSNTMEGFFSDPIYGGNRGMVSWKMIGYPGAPSNYSKDITDYQNKPYLVAPKSVDDYS